MPPILFKNCRVWDGSGAASYPADVLVENDRIRAVATQRGQLESAGADVIEANGMTLMPGLVEGHAHITFINAARATDIGDTPPEEHTLIAARNARLLLDHGFTGAYSAASAKLRIDVVIRNAIEAGELPGPRLRACGPEITVTGGLGDERRAHQFRDSFAMYADGPIEVMKLARTCVREGIDSIKLNISGDDHTSSGALPRTVMSEEEIRAGVMVARDFHRMVNAHCRAAESVKRAVRCGVDVIYHCEHADEEALDMLEAVKDRVFVGPAIGLLHAAVHEAPEGALHTGVRRGIELGLAAASRAYPEMKKRGIRVVIGGDYGFARTPQGENARDIEHFVRHLGYSPSEALVCATRYGAELMGMGNEVGQVREGFLGAVIRAAVAKDPGYAAESLIAEIRRNARYQADDYADLDLVESVDAAVVSPRLRGILEETEQFVRAMPAGVGDVATGCFAVVVAMQLARKAANARAAAYAWCLLGIADLVVAITMGAMTSPGRAHLLALAAPNLLISSYPLVMIPTFAVPLSLMLHGLVLWRLRRETASTGQLAVT